MEPPGAMWGGTRAKLRLGALRVKCGGREEGEYASGGQRAPFGVPSPFGIPIGVMRAA